MLELTFWKNWAPQGRRLLVMLLVLAAGSILYFSYGLLAGADSVIHWQSSQRAELLPLSLPGYPNPFLELPAQIDNLLVFESFVGSSLQVSEIAAYLMLLLLVPGLSMLLAVLSSLPRFWYLLGMALFTGLLISLQFEQLQLFGRIDFVGPAVLLLLFLPLSYYLQAFRQSASLSLRFGLFLLAFLILGVLVYFFAEVSHPFLYLANYGMPAFLVLTALLILLVSPEPIAAILYLVTAQSGPTAHSKQNVRHFLIISGLYLLNLILYYLRLRGVFEFELFLISPFWILLISLALAFWTLQFRFQNFGQVLPYQPWGALTYLGLVICGLSVGGYVFATDNSPWIETLEDFILYTHIGFGIVFVGYIIINFFSLLQLNKPVYKVMYQPRYMPLFTARLAAIVVVFGFYTRHGAYTFYQPMGGYYNSVGDLYLADEQYYLAREYYKLGSEYKARNHRSNYALASLAMQADDPRAAIIYLRDANNYNPTPYSYANLAWLYSQRSLFFDALFTLQKGVKDFPQEGRLRNNLGLLYAQTGLVDSALYYLQSAEGLGEIPQANALGMLASKNVRLSADSLMEKLDVQALAALQANRLAVLNRQPQLAWGGNSLPALPEISAEAGPAEVGWLLNAASAVPSADTAWANALIARTDSAQNMLFEEQLSLAAALAAYKSGQLGYAFYRMADLAERSIFKRAAYSLLLGNWALEQQLPFLARRYYADAVRLGQGQALFLQGLASLQMNRPEEAAEAWLSVPDSLLSAEQQKALSRALLLLDARQVLPPAADADSWQYSRLWLQGAGMPQEERQLALAQLEDPAQRSRLLQFWLPAWRLQADTLSMQQALHQLESLVDLLAGEEKQAAAVAALRTALQIGAPIPARLQNTLPAWWQNLVRLDTEVKEKTEVLAAYARHARQNPYASEVLLRVAALYAQAGERQEAYNLIAIAQQQNPQDPYLKEGYLRYAMALGLESYAEQTLQELRAMLPEKRFQQLAQSFAAWQEDQKQSW